MYASYLPKTIYTLWLQGRDAAPPLVQLNFERWTELNPEYTLKVLNEQDVVELLAPTQLPLEETNIQTLSDIVRSRLLIEGGIWVDATLFPTEPLDQWLTAAFDKAGFFAFDRPSPDRPIASWFLAAIPKHYIPTAWWKQVFRFWSVPRQFVKFNGSAIPPDPVWQVSPDGGGATNGFPYFWFHYLFAYLELHDSSFATQWARCAKHSAVPPHQLQHVLAQTPNDLAAVRSAVAAAPVHKLNWRQDFPIERLKAL